MIFRNIIDKDGRFCGLYRLVLQKEKYVWEYIGGTQSMEQDYNYITIRKYNDAWSFDLVEGDFDENLSPNN